MLVAGEVNTTPLATASDAVKQEMAKLLELYPGLLDSQRIIDDEEFQQPWPIEFTREGMEAGISAVDRKRRHQRRRLEGVSGDFPLLSHRRPQSGGHGLRAIHRSAQRQPASSPSCWPRSSTAPAASCIWAAPNCGGCGRWKKTTTTGCGSRCCAKWGREGCSAAPIAGSCCSKRRSIRWGPRCRFARGCSTRSSRITRPIASPWKFIDPTGKPLTPPLLMLLADKTRPGHFGGSFVAALPGNYKLELPIPESTDQLKGSISVRLPNLEFDHPEQNEQLLRALARKETGGLYLKLDEAARSFPLLLARPHDREDPVRFSANAVGPQMGDVSPGRVAFGRVADPEIVEAGVIVRDGFRCDCLAAGLARQVATRAASGAANTAQLTHECFESASGMR